MIFEALSTIQDANGLDVTAILNFMEVRLYLFSYVYLKIIIDRTDEVNCYLLMLQERYELPQNYRRSVSSKLRRLGLVGELEKVRLRFLHFSISYFSKKYVFSLNINAQFFYKCDCLIFISSVIFRSLYSHAHTPTTHSHFHAH